MGLTSHKIYYVKLELPLAGFCCPNTVILVQWRSWAGIEGAALAGASPTTMTMGSGYSQTPSVLLSGSRAWPNLNGQRGTRPLTLNGQVTSTCGASRWELCLFGSRTEVKIRTSPQKSRRHRSTAFPRTFYPKSPLRQETPKTTPGLPLR